MLDVWYLQLKNVNLGYQQAHLKNLACSSQSVLAALHSLKCYAPGNRKFRWECPVHQRESSQSVARCMFETFNKPNYSLYSICNHRKVNTMALQYLTQVCESRYNL